MEISFSLVATLCPLIGLEQQGEQCFLNYLLSSSFIPLFKYSIRTPEMHYIKVQLCWNTVLHESLTSLHILGTEVLSVCDPYHHFKDVYIVKNLRGETWVFPFTAKGRHTYWTLQWIYVPETWTFSPVTQSSECTITWLSLHWGLGHEEPARCWLLL